MSVFGSFSVEDTRKSIKKYAFSNENELVRTSQNKTKTPVRSKIIYFVFVETKKDTFKNASELKRQLECY